MTVEIKLSLKENLSINISSNSNDNDLGYLKVEVHCADNLYTGIQSEISFLFQQVGVRRPM